MNVTEAVIALLHDEVSAEVGGRIYGTELPVAEVAYMPRATIVVAASGGAGSGAGARSRAPWVQNRIDVRCYGETPYAADQVHNAVYRALTQTAWQVYGDTAIVDAEVSGGPLPGRDGDADWPYTLGVYTINAIYG